MTPNVALHRLMTECGIMSPDESSRPPLLRRVQFDRRELGVELVKDIDVMPIDPGDCLPPTVLAAERDLLLNGRRWSAGVPLRPRLAAMPGQVTDADRMWPPGSVCTAARPPEF